LERLTAEIASDDPARIKAAVPQIRALNPLRDRSAEPRRVKTRRSKYPPLNKPRAFYKKGPEKCAA
jgi:hypothetical protein